MGAFTMNRRVNVKLLASLIGAILLFALGIHLLHGFQERRNSRSLLEQAERAAEAGQKEQAVAHLRTYLGFSPNDTDALSRYGMLLSQLATNPNARLQALDVLEQVLRRDGSRIDIRQQLVELAMHPQVRRYADAREHLEILLRDNAGSPAELQRRLAQCCEAAGEFALAAQAYEKAIKSEPGRVENYTALADVLRRRLDNPGRTREVLDAMVTANPQAFAAYLARAKFRQEQGETDEAAADIAKAEQIAPEEATVLLAAGRLALAKRQHDQARKLLERGLGLHPQQAGFYLALADLEMQSRQPAKAIALLRQGVAAMPTQTDLLWSLASLLVQQKQVPTEELAKLAQLKVPAAQRDFLQARIMMNQRQWLESSRLLEKIVPGLRTNPELSAQADVALGECYGQLGNLDQQYAAYRRAVSSNPLWEPACLGLASCQSARGEIDEAMETYRRIVGRVPAVRVPMARLLIARNRRLPADGQQWSEVERLLDAVAKDSPDSVEVALARADMFATQQQFEKAEEALRQARESHPERAEIWISLAALAMRQEKFDAALAFLDEANQKLGDKVELRLARAGYLSERGGDKAAPALARLRENIDRFTAEEQKMLLRGLATCHLHRGERAEAQTLWSRLAEQSPGDLQCRLVLFDLALQKNDDENIRRLLGEMQAIEGAEGVHWRYAKACWLIRQNKQDRADSLTEAKAMLEKLAVVRPTWSRIAVGQAEISELLRDSSGAIKHYQKAIELGERQSDAIRRLVELLYQQRRYVEADEVIQKLPKGNAMEPSLVRMAAAVSLQRQDNERALKLARQAVAADSKDFRDYLWLGQFLAVTAEKDQAEPMLRRAVQLGETVPDTWVALIRYLASSGQKEKAETALADARAKLPREQAVALASCYEDLGQVDTARQLYRDALQALPDDPALLRSLASFALRRGPAEQAEQSLRKLIGMNQGAEDTAWAKRTLAVLLAGSGNYARWREAMTLVGLNEDTDAPRSTADNVEEQRVRAVVLSAQKSRRNRQRAIAVLSGLESRQVLLPEEQYLLAQLYESIGDAPAARAQMLQLLTANPTNARFIAHYAQNLLRRGDAAEAEIWVKKLEKLPEASRTFTLVELQACLLAEKSNAAGAVDLLNRFVDQADAQPANPAARMLLAGNLLDELNRKYRTSKDRVVYFEAAEKWFKQLQEKQPERILTRIAFLSRNGRTDEAMKLCETAWQNIPPITMAGVCLSVVRSGSTPAQQQQFERWLTDAVTRNPNAAANLKVYLADLNDLQGRYAEAIKLYREVLTADPKNVVALNNLGYLLALHGNAPTEAMELLNRAITLVGPTPELVDTRALIQLKLGQPDKAIRDLETALADAPLPAASYHLAQAHHLARNTAAARDALLKAKGLGLEADHLHALERPTYQQLHAELAPR
jgi:cellulose synthase operon protein C